MRRELEQLLLERLLLRGRSGSDGNLLVGRALGLNGDGDDRLREGNAFQNEGLAIAESIAGEAFLEAKDRADTKRESSSLTLGKQVPEMNPASPLSDPKASKKKRNKFYLRELARLHVELVKMQEWVIKEGKKVCIVFEGRDGAGKGGTIKAITERVSPRVFRVVALPAPTEREKSQMYIQRYIGHLPAAGEVVIFDRSWYNRAGVERVMGFCTPDEHRRFLRQCPQFERMLVEDGVLVGRFAVVDDGPLADRFQEARPKPSPEEPVEEAERERSRRARGSTVAVDAP